VELVSLEQLCKLAVVPGEARNRLFVDGLHPCEASEAAHGIGMQCGFLEAHAAFSERLAFRRNGHRPEAKRVATSPVE
jgi:hypothetical protein